MKKIILLIFILTNQINFAQYNSMRVGGIIVELGAEYEYVISSYKNSGIKIIQVVSQPNKQFMLQYPDEDFTFIGSISFIDDKLHSIQKFWGPYKIKDNNFEFLNDYFEILKLFGEKPINSLLTTTEYYEPDNRLKKIIISNGNKEVELFFTPVEIHITERIEQ